VDRYPEADWIRWICHAAAPRTTSLSRAFLRAAADRMADERWHTLLGALKSADPQSVEQAFHAVVAYGATSGLDMLAGFLWTTERPS
jgi:hypothetical protein